MKFGDVVTVVASLAVLYVVISFLLGTLFVSALGYYWGMNVNAIVSILLCAVIGGVIFARKIWEEAGIQAIAKIVVLVALLMAFNVGIAAAALPDRTAWVKQMYLDANPTATPSAFEWYAIESVALYSQIVLNVVLAFVLSFIGLYAGSMLRKPVKSQK